jgi:phenylalanyl-tRNA synthetase beta subunit
VYSWSFGKNSGVSEHTTSIFLESAYFNPVSIRKTAKRHQLNTDASSVLKEELTLLLQHMH